MKTPRILVLCACIVLVLAASCTNNPSGGGTTGEVFSFKQGDYTVYNNDQLDSNNVVIRDSSFRSTRTVVRTGVSLGGQTDAVLVIDSTFFGTTARVRQIDTTYYRVSNNQVFIYFDLNRFVSILGGSAGGIDPSAATGVMPQWVQVAALTDAASSQNFPTGSFTATLASQGVQLSTQIVGRGQGKVTYTLNGTAYQVHRQTQTTTVSIVVPLFGKIDVVVPAEYDFGIPSQNAPRAILRTETKATKIVIPILGTTIVPGRSSTFVSFKAGV
jgi:hypothetical protein